MPDDPHDFPVGDKERLPRALPLCQAQADEIVLQFFGPAQPERLEPVAGTPEPHPQAGSERVGVEYLAGGGAVSGEFSRGRCAQFAYGIAPPERHGIPRNGQGHGRFLGAQRFFDDFRDTAAVAQEDALAQVAGLAGGALEQVAPNRLDTVRGALDAEFPPQQGDDAALQATVDLALKTHRNVLIPPGHYRLSRGLRVANPQGLTIQGTDAVNTVLDISDGEGACITSVNGTEITLRNLTMSGHSGFDARDQCGLIPTRGSSYFWGFAAKNCNATTISGTERALIENCHGTRMASECFVAACKSRGLTKPGTTNSTGTTYLRCTATNLGRNAFNDVTCGPENTSVLQCRIVDVGGCAWEGASRFVRFIGNYVRNAGTVAMGNLGAYPPLLAAWGPFFLFLLIGEAVLIQTEE